jgi:hypothetical protein
VPNHCSYVPHQHGVGMAEIICPRRLEPINHLMKCLVWRIPILMPRAHSGVPFPAERELAVWNPSSARREYPIPTSRRLMGLNVKVGHLRL